MGGAGGLTSVSRQVHLQVGLAGPRRRGRVPPPHLLLGRLLHLLVVVVPAGSRAGVRDRRPAVPGPGHGQRRRRGAGRYRAIWFRRIWCTKPWLMSSRPPGLQHSLGPGPRAASIRNPGLVATSTGPTVALWPGDTLSQLPSVTPDFRLAGGLAGRARFAAPTGWRRSFFYYYWKETRTSADS